MNSDRIPPPRVTFIICATVSAIASGTVTVVPGAGLLLPGVLFGIAIAYAISCEIEALRPISVLLLVALSIFGFWIACLTAVLTYRWCGGGNNFMTTAVVGATAGGAGASFITAGMALSSEYFRSLRVFVVTTLAGTAYGAVFGLVAVWLRDDMHAPIPLDFVVVFLIWQVGVATAIPLPTKLHATNAS